MSALDDARRLAEFAEEAIASMHRVWTKAVEAGRGDWKELVEMGDILYHATDGEKGACGRYDMPECAGGKVPEGHR